MAGGEMYTQFYRRAGILLRGASTGTADQYYCMPTRHPLTDEILKVAPSGPLLEALYRRFNPKPGEIENALQPETVEKLMASKGLDGKKLVAATTDDLELLANFVDNGPTTVRHAAVYNKRLTGAQVKKLHDTAVGGRDGRLAMALVRARPDVVFYCAKSGSLFELLSLRSGHGAIDALAHSIVRMNQDEFAALRKLNGPTINEMRASAYGEVLELYNAGYRVEPSTLAIILKEAPIQYGQRPRITSGLTRILPSLSSSTRETLVERLEEKVQRRGAKFLPVRPATGHNNTHSCSFAGMQRIDTAMAAHFGKAAAGISPNWRDWSRPLGEYENLGTTEQVDLLTKHPEIAEEVLYHIPGLYEAVLENHLKHIPARVVAAGLQLPGGLETAIRTIVEGKMPKRNDVAEVLAAGIDITKIPKKHYAKCLQVFFDNPGLESLGETLMQHIEPDQFAELIRDITKGSKAHLKLREIRLAEVATDPYAEIQEIQALVDLPCGTVNLGAWSKPALRWAAQHIIDMIKPEEVNLYNFDALDSLAHSTRVPFGEFAKMPTKLGKRAK